MTAALIVLGWLLFVVAMAVGLALDIIGFFGNWVILAAAVIAWFATGYGHWNVYILLILLGLAIFGEVVELVASGWGASRFGGSRGAIVAALIGCIIGGVVGTPLFPVIGTVLGACLGAFAGAMLHELVLMRETFQKAAKAGFGAALGKIAGMAIKLAVGIAMIAILALSF
jgi:uncharacterized protein